MSRDAVVLAFLSLADLSYGDPQTRPEFVRRLAPWDTPADADDMCSSQSCCATATQGALLIAEVDGEVRDFRGRLACDPLREPRRGRYDAIPYLQTLASQHGLLRRPLPGSTPAIEAGCVVHVGTGGAEHVFMVTGDPDSEGFVETVEGGQVDPLSKRTGAASCTAIRRKRRTWRKQGSLWCLFDDKGRDGRAIVWWFQAGDLPTVKA